MPKMKIGKLNDMYNQSDSADQTTFAEQRSNIRLVVGDHYTKNTSQHLERLRTSKQITEQIKLRLTKNHISRIAKLFTNSITNLAPGVAVVPQNDKENQDIKAAELHNSVWKYVKGKYRMREKIRSWAYDFIVIGEVFVKIFWDGQKGKPVLTSQVVNEAGQLLEQTMTISGELIYERIYGFNLLIDPAAKEFEEARYVISRKMKDKKELKAKYKDQEDKLEFIASSADDTYKVFNGKSGAYEETKNQVMIREFYFRPSIKYPNGYFYLTTNKGILEEGALPGGLFPIVRAGFDEIPTCSRAQSIIKQLRPYQAEINRSGSKIAEHQITLGDDKILIQSGTKIAHGGSVAGIRGVQYSGMPPSILPGRDGSQYLQYMQSQITEMYEVAGIQEISANDKDNGTDLYTRLFESMRNKQRFSYYSEKFERFLIDVCDLSLRLYKQHALPQTIIPIIGRSEMVNMKEYKTSEDIGFEIRLEPMSEDAESLVGRQLSLERILQYGGSELGQEAIGKIAQSMPFIKDTVNGIFADQTLNADIAQNNILALDRGELPEVFKYDDHGYLLSRYIHRIRKSDFRFLSPEIQQNYRDLIDAHERAEAERIQEQKRIEAELIPTDGPLISCDMYTEVPNSTGGVKTVKIKIPQSSLERLMQILETQGQTQESIQQQVPEAQVDIMQQALSGQGNLPNQ